MAALKIQIRTKTGWEDIGLVHLLGGESEGVNAKTEFCYDIDYATKHVDETGHRAVSCLLPVTFEPITFDSWPPFLLDLFPQGAALQIVLDHYRILDRPESYWKIITTARLNPPGNLRVYNETGTANEFQSDHKGFNRREVIEKGAGFLEYMIKRGAPVAGSTGAGGAAPKFLLREDKKGFFHADGVLPDSKTKACWLVKFPRGKHQSDIDILKAEKSYLDIARKVGLSCHEELKWEDDCLFMPRFDRRLKSGKVDYLGLESFYSVVGLPEFGSRLMHETYLDGIAKYSDRAEDDIIEYCLRDLLNQMMGNTDNHGRNQSMLKAEGLTCLAPLYDFAPMKFDREGIVRNTRWQESIEQGDLIGMTKLLLSHYEIEGAKWNKALVNFRNKTENLDADMKSNGINESFIKGSRDERKRLNKSLQLACEKL